MSFAIQKPRPLQVVGGSRIATIEDHDFLVKIDLKNEGYTTSDEAEMTPIKKQEHRDKILKFLTDPDKGAYIMGTFELSTKRTRN